MSSLLDVKQCIEFYLLQLDFFNSFQLAHIKAGIAFDFEITNSEQPMDDLHFLIHITDDDEFLFWWDEVRNEVADWPLVWQPVSTSNKSFTRLRTSIQQSIFVF